MRLRRQAEGQDGSWRRRTTEDAAIDGTLVERWFRIGVGAVVEPGDRRAEPTIVARFPLLTTVVMPWLVTPAPPPNAPYAAAEPRLTPPPHGSTLVEKLQTRSATMELPARSLTPAAPDFTVATKVLLAANPGAAATGTKDATRLAAS